MQQRLSRRTRGKRGRWLQQQERSGHATPDDTSTGEKAHGAPEASFSSASPSMRTTSFSGPPPAARQAVRAGSVQATLDVSGQGL